MSNGGTPRGAGRSSTQTTLTAKQARFVAEYLIDLNATQAAIRAGYSRKSAEQQAYENLRKPEIAQAITAGKAQQLETAELSAARVLEELRRLALIDALSFWDAEGRLKKPSEWTAEQGAALAGFEVLIKNAKRPAMDRSTRFTRSSCGTRRAPSKRSRSTSTS